jgi:SET domain-containing protein
MKLFVSEKIEVRESPIHGRGVFAVKTIEAGEIIEECHFILLEQNFEDIDNNLKEYVFSWPKNSLSAKSSVVLGNGSIYNHSKNNNADWKTVIEKNIFQFFAIKKIKEGEEICTNYGEAYENFVKKLN